MLVNPVNISSLALVEIKKMFLKNGLDPQFGLRIGVKGAGCAGTTFFLGFDNKKENDAEFFSNDVKIFIEKKHILYLLGVELDFIDNNSQRGFTFVEK